MDPTLPQFEIHSLAQEMDAALIRERLIATLSSLFSGLALLLACVGLYGLLAFAVVQRTGEVGIRMARGASRSDVLGMILREAWMLAFTGIAIGLPASIAMGRLLTNQISGLLFGLNIADPVTIAGAVTLLVAVASMAAYVPARRRRESTLWWRCGTSSDLLLLSVWKPGRASVARIRVTADVSHPVMQFDWSGAAPGAVQWWP